MFYTGEGQQTMASRPNTACRLFCMAQELRIVFIVLNNCFKNSKMQNETKKTMQQRVYVACKT